MGAYRIIPIVEPLFDGRCYLAVCAETSQAALIDAGAPIDTILRTLEAEHACLRVILLTHGHFDHFLSLEELCSTTGAGAAIHRLDHPALSNPAINMSALFGRPLASGAVAETLLDEGMVVPAGSLALSVLHTPGHTPGSCCFRLGDDLFTGDTLFRGAYGNTGFPGGDMAALRRSAERLLSLQAAITMHPGHGGVTTVGRERAQNPIRT